MPSPPTSRRVRYEFECERCGWKGTAPVLDAHLNAFCPACGRPAEFAEVLKRRRER